MAAVRRRATRFGLAISLASIALPPLWAQDVLTIGGSQCIQGVAGQVVNVPVFIRDVSGTLLGVDRPLGSRIDAFGFNVFPNPASAIPLNSTGRLTVTTSSAGITSGLPMIGSEFSGGTASSFGYVVNYVANSIPFVSNSPSPGNQVANIAITL